MFRRMARLASAHVPTVIENVSRVEVNAGPIFVVARHANRMNHGPNTKSFTHVIMMVNIMYVFDRKKYIGTWESKI